MLTSFKAFKICADPFIGSLISYCFYYLQILAENINKKKALFWMWISIYENVKQTCLSQTVSQYDRFSSVYHTALTNIGVGQDLQCVSE